MERFENITHSPWNQEHLCVQARDYAYANEDAESSRCSCLPDLETLLKQEVISNTGGQTISQHMPNVHVECLLKTG